jgi:hypothetical protein
MLVEVFLLAATPFFFVFFRIVVLAVFPGFVAFAMTFILYIFQLYILKGGKNYHFSWM